MVFIHLCCYGISRSWRSLYNTVVCMAFVQKKKKLGERKTGVLKRMLIRDLVDLYFALRNIKQKLSGF